MSSSRLPLSSRPSFLPDEISKREFATVFRGYDPAEVRTFLNQLAEQAAEASDRVAVVQRSLVETEERVKNPELDEETVTRLLGSQTAQILRSAREAANDIRQKAEDEVSRQLREAHEVTTKMREEAEALLSDRTEEAESVAAAIKAATEKEIAQMRADTEAEMLALRQRTQSDLVDERSKARAQIRDLIDTARAEAQHLVDRTQAKQSELIEGLVRKRKIALAQVEELRAGRARLLDAYKLVRTTLDEVTVELGRAEDDAREQATAAGQRSAEESGIDADELDSIVDIEQFSLDDDVSRDVVDIVENDDDADFASKSYPQPQVKDVGGVAVAEQKDLLIDAESDVEVDEEAEHDAEELRRAGDFDGALIARREAVVGKACSQMLRRLKRVLQEEQDAVIARLQNGQAQSVQAVLGSADDQIATYQRCVVRLFREVVRSGVGSVDGDISVERSVTDHTGTSAAREFVGEMVGDLRSQLVPAVEQALEPGDRQAGNKAQVVSRAYKEVRGKYLESLVAERIGGAFDQGVAFAQQS